MKKYGLYVLILFFFFSISAAQLSLSQVYKNNYKGVALVEEGIYLDSSKFENIGLFKRLDNLVERKLLNEYYCYARGSAFIVSKKGYLLTNHHVIGDLAKEQRQEMIYFKFISEIMNNVPPGFFTQKELRTIVDDFYHILLDSDFKLVCRFYDNSISLSEVLVSDSGSDISLLKTDIPKGAPVLRMGSSKNITPGQEISAIGFPLQNLMENFLTECKATFTTGVISALRDEKWGIQHTSSINPGNSGGPLLSRDGMVVGINVGMVTNANNLYFAIPIDRCVTVLDDLGYSFRNGSLRKK